MNTIQTQAETELKQSEEILHPVNARYHGESALPGLRFANAVIGFMGSWAFLILQTIVCGVWIALNVVAWFRHFDPYPFIFLNLAFSAQAAYAAPLILMASNVASAKDRELWENDYATNQKAYDKIEALERQIQAVAEQNHELLNLLSALDHRRAEENLEAAWPANAAFDCAEAGLSSDSHL